MSSFLRVVSRITRKIKSKIGLYYNALFYCSKDNNKKSAKDASTYLLQYYTPKEEGVFFQTAQDHFDLDVSFIIPVYNGEKYLRKCLDSVINQNTDYSYEVICINDGSTDQSESILKEYSNIDNFKYVNKENGGISSACNYGIKLSRGHYISFLDNDDYISDDFLQIMLTNILYNNADIAKCGYYSVSNEIVKKAYIEGKSKLIDCQKSSDIFLYNGFCWGMLINRSLFSDVSFPVGYWYEDMITRLILYPQCKEFSYVAQPLYYYRFHSNNSSSVVWKSSNYKSFDQYYLAKACLNWLVEKDIYFSTGLCLAFQYELCNMLYSRTIQLDDKIKECLFVLACETNNELLQLCPEYKNSGNLIQRRLTQTMINGDFKKWKCLCSYLVV